MPADFVIGIDPGCSGAIVVLAAGQQGLEPIEWLRMPTLKVGSASRVNSAVLARFLGNYPGAHAFLEQVHSMPGQGVSSVFGFGHATGVVDGVLGALAIPYTLVTPQAWKKRAGLIGEDKDAARSRAIQLWPRWDALDKKGAGQAFADAALIGFHGRTP